MTIQIIENTADYTFIKTCNCCPEQYEVLDYFGKHIAYVRYRYGRLTCQMPDVRGIIVFDRHIGDEFDGCFANDEERRHYLGLIADTIQKYMED